MPDQINYDTSWTQICNQALGRMGTANITDMEEATTNAEFCRRFLPQAVQHVLGQYDFACSRRRAVLAALAEKPAFEWAEQFAIPADLLRVISAADIDGNPTSYVIENGKILTEDPGRKPVLKLVYTARPYSPEGMPHYLRNAISATLAYMLATAMSGSEQLLTILVQESSAMIEIAKKEDAQNGFDIQAKGERFYTELRGSA
jgi:hypothetical protein